MEALVEDERVSRAGREEMLNILRRQHFRENIPAGLPPGTDVANKTGWITGINHDAALIFPRDGAPYVLVVLLRGHPAEDQGTALAAEISRTVWAHHVAGRDPQ
jgi:beta-lactamase class A